MGVEHHGWPWPVIKFCCEEIVRQRDTVMAVPDLLRAWEDAIFLENDPHRDRWAKITPGVLEKWAFLAVPELNARGFRRHNVEIGDSKPADWRDVPRLVEKLCESIREGNLQPAEAYYEYEMIHPFADGNGRTGKVLYNFMLGTLAEPRLPPNFWGHDNL